MIWLNIITQSLIKLTPYLLYLLFQPHLQFRCNCITSTFLLVDGDSFFHVFLFLAGFLLSSDSKTWIIFESPHPFVGRCWWIVPRYLFSGWFISWVSLQNMDCFCFTSFFFVARLWWFVPRFFFIWHNHS